MTRIKFWSPSHSSECAKLSTSNLALTSVNECMFDYPRRNVCTVPLIFGNWPDIISEMVQVKDMITTED